MGAQPSNFARRQDRARLNHTANLKRAASRPPSFSYSKMLRLGLLQDYGASVHVHPFHRDVEL